jgi:hypothetical protein
LRRCGRWRRRRPSSAARAEFLEPVLAVLLYAPECPFELLVAELELLDDAGELADLVFQTIEPYDQLATGGLHLARLRGGRRVESFAAAEELVEETGGLRSVLRRGGGRDQNNRDEC